MSESTRKYNFDNVMLYLKDRMKLLPNLESKYMGLMLPFPQEKALLNMIIESIKRLIEHDQDVCIAVHFNQSDAGTIEYKKIVFIGTDYLHLKKIADFMKRQDIKLDIKDTCILYKECTADLNINLKGNHSSSCSMCFYRDYYYISGAHISLKTAMQEADWKICEPLMQVHMTCNKLYFKGNSFFSGVENLCILDEDEDNCKLSFKSILSTIIGVLEEMYDHKQDVLDFHMELDSYVPVEDVTQLKEEFKMINNIDKWKDELEEQEMNSAIPPV